MSRGYARSREKDEAVRASLEPLAPGERPGAVTVAAVVALVLGLSLIVQVLVVDDADVDGLLVFAAVMFVAAAGMWKAQYWAVLGFEFFLGLTLVFAAVSLMFASNVRGAILAVVVLGLAGTLFWKLVKAMARLQMPKRPGGPMS
jgi:hypothetical protein